jgi:hypothetical protein
MSNEPDCEDAEYLLITKFRDALVRLIAAREGMADAGEGSIRCA